MQIPELYTVYKQHPSVQTDTRKIKPGDLFFALKGENFNGNVFAQEAIAKGAAFAVVDEAVDAANKKIIKVDNVLETLQQLAKHHRQQFDIPVIAITGSNGKTTTKELIHAVLSSQYITYTTEGNLNNHIGIPLTLLKIKPGAEIAIVEMGANHQKEIESYCKYTLPTHGLITNCGKAHLEGFGGEEGVRKGKGELFDYLAANNGTAFVMQDYDYLKEMCRNVTTVVTYGTADDAGTIGRVKDASGFLSVALPKETQVTEINTHLVGSYNLPNVLAAVAVGKYFNVPSGKIKAAIENYIPSNSRSQLIKKDGNTVILDAYNANPSSITLAIENFAKMKGENKILMLGGMMELGQDSIKEHEQIVNLVKKYQWMNVVLVGGDFKTTHGPYEYFDNSEEAGKWLKSSGIQNAHILIKGSRSMKMERVIE